MLTLTPIRARLLLAALLALFVIAASVTIPKPAPAGIPAPTVADSQMFDAVVTRLRLDENYYVAMGTELRHRFYPAASVFNWRMPGLYRFLAVTPDWVRPASFATLSVVVFVLTAVHLRHMNVALIALTLVADAGILYAMWSAQLMPETWCGLLIALSALAYARSSWMTGALMGLLALFVRELAAPYCAICVLLAVRGRRRHELMLWISGAVVFAVVYALHVTRVWAHQQPGDFVPAPWMRFGWLPFILETIQQTNAWLVKLPAIATAIVVVLLAAAPWAPTAPPHISGMVLVYGVFLFVVGQIFNDYWGFVTAPTAAIALAYSYDGLRTVIRHAQLT